MTPRGSAVWLAGVLALLVVARGQASSILAQRADEPLLILISFDGFRWDYLQKASAPALHRLIERGVRADGLIPSYPTKTFPNLVRKSLARLVRGLEQRSQPDRTSNPRSEIENRQSLAISPASPS